MGPHWTAIFIPRQCGICQLHFEIGPAPNLTGHSRSPVALISSIQQQVVVMPWWISGSVEQFLGCARQDVSGDEVVAALTEDSNGVLH